MIKGKQHCKLVFLLLFIASTLGLQAQKILDRKITTIPFKVFLSEKDTLDLHQIDEFQDVFVQPHTVLEKTHPKNYYWLQVDFSSVSGDLSTNEMYYLRTPNFEYSTLYSKSGDSINEISIGRLQEGIVKTSRLYHSGVPFNKDQLINDRFLYLKVQRTSFFQQVSSWEIGYIPAFKNELIDYYYNARDLDRMIPVFVFAGISLVMFTLTLAFFLYTRRKEFLFYTLYILFLFLYLSPYVLDLHTFFFGGFNLYSYTFFQVAQVLINLAYILFVIYYLDTRTDYNKLHRALVVIVWVLAAISIFDVLFLLTENFIAHIHLLNFERIVMTVFGVVGMTYLILRKKDALAIFIVAGSLSYMVGALGLLFFGNRLFMISGASIEILIFASGLTYKIQQEYKDKLRVQKEALQHKNNALRAQMNPHFIFNSLSSIQYLITSGDKMAAVKYLNKFSLLMRNLLESSIEGNVLLQEEIETLTKYLDLEALRFDNTFDYHIDVAPELDPKSIEIPALIVQPFAENAIQHGLLTQTATTKKTLAVRFRKADGLLVCEIEDNGVGRAQALANASKLKRSKKSRGIDVTQKRLEMASDFTFQPVEIIDKKDVHGNGTGTLVIIKISLE